MLEAHGLRDYAYGYHAFKSFGTSTLRFRQKYIRSPLPWGLLAMLEAHGKRPLGF